MNIMVEEITSHDDGSVTISFDFDSEALIAFAKIGLRRCLEVAVMDVEGAEDGCADTEGVGDAPAGADGGTDVPEEFPGF
jgi:hypothetical protein